MDGVRTVSRVITEVDGFRLAAYDVHKQRLLSCSGATQLTVHHRAGGDTIWKPTDSWDSPHDVTQARVMIGNALPHTLHRWHGRTPSLGTLLQ